MIRPARLSDVPEIARIHVEAWPHEQGGASPSLDRRLELWNHVLGGGARRTQVWVALDALGEVLGFASAGAARLLRARFEGEVTALYVAPDAWRQGHGTALVVEARARLRDLGQARVMVWVPEAGSCLAFFAHLGAVLTDERRVAKPQGIEGISVSEIALYWP